MSVAIESPYQPADLGEAPVEPVLPPCPGEGLTLPAAWAEELARLSRDREAEEARAYQRRWGRAKGWEVDYRYANALALDDLHFLCESLLDIPSFLCEARPAWWPESEGGRVGYWANLAEDTLLMADLLTGRWMLRVIVSEGWAWQAHSQFGHDVVGLVALRLGVSRSKAAWAIARCWGLEPWRFRRTAA